MNFTTDGVFTGQTKNIMIVSGGKKYYVPIAVYKPALKATPTNVEEFGHTIDASIDAHISPSANLIIYFMHCAALPNDIKARTYPLLSLHEINQLVDALAVISWCETMLKPSGSYNNYKKAVIDSIHLAIKTARAILADNSECVGGLEARINILKSCELPITIPDYIDGWILLPCVIEGYYSRDARKIIHNTLHKYKNGLLSIHHGELRIYEDEKTSWKMRFFEGDARLPLKPGDILDKQHQLLNDILSREVRIMAYEHPEYMKIPGFGDMCASQIHSLTKPQDLILHCKSKPKMTICHIFQYGLAGALSATYE